MSRWALGQTRCGFTRDQLLLVWPAKHPTEDVVDVRHAAEGDLRGQPYLGRTGHERGQPAGVLVDLPQMAVNTLGGGRKQRSGPTPGRPAERPRSRPRS